VIGAPTRQRAGRDLPYGADDWLINAAAVAWFSAAAHAQRAKESLASGMDTLAPLATKRVQPSLTKAEAKARAGNVCLLATRASVVDLFGSSRELAPDAAVLSATGVHL
jgi:hypothetical protein